MEIQDYLVIFILLVLIVYDVIEYVKAQNEDTDPEGKKKEKYPRDNLKQHLPPATYFYKQQQQQQQQKPQQQQQQQHHKQHHLHQPENRRPLRTRRSAVGIDNYDD